MVVQAIALVLCGLVIGVLGGLLGIGGGTVIVPLLRLAFGFEPLMATATSLFSIIFTSVSGTAAHVRGKTCLPKLGIAMGVGGAVTSTLGVWLARISPGWLVMAVAAVVILYSAITMFRKALKVSDTASEDLQQTSPKLSGRTLVAGFCIGMVAGIASGYIGVGGGFIMVPLMLALLGVPMKKASGTSLIAVMILAIPGTIANIAYGNVAFVAGICLVIGSIPGAILGARLVNRVPERALRFLFAAFLVVAALTLIVREFLF